MSIIVNQQAESIHFSPRLGADEPNVYLMRCPVQIFLGCLSSSIGELGAQA